MFFNKNMQEIKNNITELLNTYEENKNFMMKIYTHEHLNTINILIEQKISAIIMVYKEDIPKNIIFEYMESIKTDISSKTLTEDIIQKEIEQLKIIIDMKINFIEKILKYRK